MDIEFHYYITKGIALRAGFNDDEAENHCSCVAVDGR